MPDNMNMTSVKQSKTVCIVAGGEMDTQYVSAISTADVVIGADRGALWLIEHGIDPDVVIGDFDSVTVQEKRIVHDHAGRYIEYSSDKDETDLELAIEEAVRYKPMRVIIYGVLGKRLDHTLTAIYLLERLESHNIYGEIVDNFNKIYIVRRLMSVSKDSGYPYISLLPLGVSVNITLRGFLYDVTKRSLLRAASLGVSNRILAKNASIQVHRGKILVIRSSDVRVRSRIS